MRNIQPGQLVLDPFAGVGYLLHDAVKERGAKSVGIEIEPEWADQHPWNKVGDATALPKRWTNRFDVVATSCTYGNRMSDHHNAQERCKACDGTGLVDIPLRTNNNGFGDCPKCGGVGRRQYKRITYRHQLGRELHPNNSGQMPFGPKYKDLHERAWVEAARVLKPTVKGVSKGRMILNVSNHFKTIGPKGDRRQVEVDVVGWHLDTLKRLGFKLERTIEVETPRMRFGQNHEARAEHEIVAILRSPGRLL